MNTSFTGSKPHYLTLDALRGAAALMVVFYHIFEGYAFAGSVGGGGDGIIRWFNHGYLAVDFFFLLSGFVISYAYDDRWAQGMSLRGFFGRRLRRLHPMVVLGAVIGAAAFCLQGRMRWDGTVTPVSFVMLAMLMAMFMIPAVPGTGCEVRGNGEMFPLNGPSWSLFFEYIGNILYALAIRRLSTRWLKVLCAVTGACHFVFAAFDLSGYGSIGVGWTLDGLNFFGGLLRMMFPFTLGMLIQRELHSGTESREQLESQEETDCQGQEKNVRNGLYSRLNRPIKGAMWICVAVMAALFAIPYLPWRYAFGESGICFCANGVFEFVCIGGIFPILLLLGASASVKKGSAEEKLYKASGDLSYPLYLVHYPVMYLFYAHLIRTGKFTFAQTWPEAIGVYAICVILGILCLKLYDEPARKLLNRKR